MSKVVTQCICTDVYRSQQRDCKVNTTNHTTVWLTYKASWILKEKLAGANLSIEYIQDESLIKIPDYK